MAKKRNDKPKPNKPKVNRIAASGDAEKELRATDPNIAKILDHMDESDRQTFIARISTFHAGPIPAPSTLKEYNKIIPNGAERIMQSAEKQQHHRHDMERRSLIIQEEYYQKQARHTSAGQIFGFILGLVGLGGGILLAYADRPWPGGSLSIGSLAALVTVFVVGRKKRIDEHIEP